MEPESTLVGFGFLKAKHSAVNSRGALQIEPLAGLRIRLTRPVPHEDGHLIEIARSTWPEMEWPVVQVHMTTTLPGRVRAWGLHRRNTDRLFVAAGLVRIVCYDGRRDSPTFGYLNEITLSDRSPGLVLIPPCVYHGWKNIGTTEAIVINMPVDMYNYETPDALDLPWDSPEAAELIPYVW